MYTAAADRRPSSGGIYTNGATCATAAPATHAMTAVGLGRY